MADALHRWMRQQRQNIPDGSATARAIDYSLNRWGELTRFLDDGDLRSTTTGWRTASYRLQKSLPKTDRRSLWYRVVFAQQVVLWNGS